MDTNGFLESLQARHVASHLAALRKALPGQQRFVAGLEHGALSAAAAVLAYAPVALLDVPQDFWAAITAVAVVQTEYNATRSTARDQFTGAAMGGVIALGVLALVGQHIAAYALAVLAAVLAAWLCNVASAARLAGTTATIILLVPHDGRSPQIQALVRIGEVGWGVAVAIGVVWLFGRLTFRGGHNASSQDRPAAAGEKKAS